MSVIKDFEIYDHSYRGKQCPHCAHRRKAEVTIYWLIHNGVGDSIEVLFCDSCAVRLARGILQDVDNSMIRTNLLNNESEESDNGG